MGTRENEPDTIKDLARRVRAYLAGHQGAADTLEGIALWWLARDGASVDLRLLEIALERMANGGELLRVELPDGRRLYRRA